MMETILVSACLLGRPVRYDGKAKPLPHPALARWHAEGRVVAICPEVSAGLSIPRAPAEIAASRTGADVLTGKAAVIDVHGADLTDPFRAGAEAALDLARTHRCRFALLIDGSPSCGSSFIYDGSFSGIRRAGDGVTAALLRRHGIEVFAPTEIAALEARLAEGT
jgi:uncharacterized protein YbbK (DUF523 family)